MSDSLGILSEEQSHVSNLIVLVAEQQHYQID